MSKNKFILVAQFTDTHILADPKGEMLGCPTRESFQAAIASLKTLETVPDLLLLTGDLSQDETPESYQYLQDCLQPLSIPCYWIPGNHDDPAIMEQVFQSSSFSNQKSFSYGNWQFILLDSRLSHHVEGYLAPATLTWLETELKQHRDRHTLIAVHHHPVKINSPWMDEIKLQNSTALLTILNKYPQVRLVLFGHIHQEFSQEDQGIHYLGSPSTCVQFQPHQKQLKLDAAFPGFRLIYLNTDGSFKTEVKRVNFN